MNKQIFVVSLIALIALGLFAGIVNAQTDNRIEWRIVFFLNSQKVAIGASDYYTGYTPALQDYLGTHIGAGAAGNTAKTIYYGARSPLSETIVMWNNNSSEDFAGILSWQWQNWDRAKDKYVTGPRPFYLEAKLSLVTGVNGEIVTKLEPNGGSLRIKLDKNDQGVPVNRLALSVSFLAVKPLVSQPATKVAEGK